MIVFTPETRLPVFYGQNYDTPTCVFLAGGITGCRDWQADAIEMLSKYEGCVFNPRCRFNPENMERQISWEYDMLRVGSVIFWFPRETVCPITLFELGSFVGARRKSLYIGTHPNYSRRMDIICQLKKANYNNAIHDTLQDTVNEYIKSELEYP